MIRVILPQHLRALAAVEREVQLDVKPPVTPRTILDALDVPADAIGYAEA